MQTFIKKYYNKQQVTQEEVFSFLVEYCKLFPDVKQPTAQDLQGILMLIQQGVFNLSYVVEVASKKIEMNITKLFDKNNNLIRVDIKE